LDIEQETKEEEEEGNIRAHALRTTSKTEYLSFSLSVCLSREVNALVLFGQEDNAETIRIVHKRKQNKVQ
jgi:hypothetical protein